MWLVQRTFSNVVLSFNNCRSHNKCCSPRPQVKIYVSLECLLFALLKTDAPKFFLYCPLYVLDLIQRECKYFAYTFTFYAQFLIKISDISQRLDKTQNVQAYKNPFRINTLGNSQVVFVFSSCFQITISDISFKIQLKLYTKPFSLKKS